MAVITSLTVLKADAVTNITYAIKQPGNGGNGPAEWRQDASNSNPIGMRSLLRLWTDQSSSKQQWVTNVMYAHPIVYTETTTGLIRQLKVAYFKGQFVVPTDAPAAQTNEGVYQGLNLLAHPEIKLAFASGVTPT